MPSDRDTEHLPCTCWLCPFLSVIFWLLVRCAVFPSVTLFAQHQCVLLSEPDFSLFSSLSLSLISQFLSAVDHFSTNGSGLSFMEGPTSIYFCSISDHSLIPTQHDTVGTTLQSQVDLCFDGSSSAS